MRIFKEILLLIWLTVTTKCLTLHIKSQIHQQAPAFNTLTDYVTTIKNSLTVIFNNTTLSTSDPPSISIPKYQKAIIEENKALSKLVNTLISSRNYSQQICAVKNNTCLSDLNKTLLSLKLELDNLKKMIDGLNNTSDLTTQMKSVVSQQMIEMIDSMNISKQINCSKPAILSPTVFQTNLYSLNWILGPQSYDDVVKQYYKRSITYENVTNCPLNKPYFNGSLCIECSNVFNLFTRKCQSCEQASIIDNTQHICKPQDKATNYSKVQNYWISSDQMLPNITGNNIYMCPDAKPYLIGSTCVVCELPAFFNITNSSCRLCPNNYTFNINVKQCVLSSTNLSNTDLNGPTSAWIAANITQVYSYYKNLSKSGQALPPCPTDKPYFDGTLCISCPQQFDIDKKICVTAPQNMVYDANIRNYIVPQSNRQTSSQSSNYIMSSPPLVSSNQKPDCPLNAPFYDGIACIACITPLQIFNVDTLKCISCHGSTYFNASSHQCIKKQVVYLPSNNTNRIMATQNVNISQYNANIMNLTNQSNIKIRKCSNPQTEYSTGSQCITCQSDQYFNIQHLVCMKCNGDYNNITKLCVLPPLYLTNLLNTSIVGFKTNATDAKSQINSILKNNSAAVICPSQTPFAVTVNNSKQNTTCISCPTIFNYTSGECTQCPDGTVFMVSMNQCLNFFYLTNYSANGILLSNGIRLKQLINNQTQFIKKHGNMTALCPNDKPFSGNGNNCFSCSAPNNLFDVARNSCASCLQFTIFYPSTNTCQAIRYKSNLTAGKYLQTQNATYDDYVKEQNQTQNGPIVNCNSNKPYATTTGCIACNDSSLPYFSLHTRICSSCPSSNQNIYNSTLHKCLSGTYISNLNVQSAVIQTDNFTIANIKSINNIPKSGQITLLCPSDQPFSIMNASKCTACNESNPIFDLKLAQCVACPSGSGYDIKSKKCTNITLIPNFEAISTMDYIAYEPQTLKSYQDSFNNISGLTSICPNNAPFVINGACSRCNANGTYFEISTRQCRSCNYSNHNCLTFYSNMNNTNWISSNPNKVYLQNKILQSAPGAQMCQLNTPFYNSQTTQCVNCPDTNANIFNYQTNQCVSCPIGTILSRNSHTCTTLIAPNTFQTNLKSPNLIVGGISSAQYAQQYQNQILKYPNIQDCPAQQPYFDGFTCTTCPAYAPYFNLNYKVCQSCTNYDATTNQCLNTNGTPISTDPNIAKMYSSIF